MIYSWYTKIASFSLNVSLDWLRVITDFLHLYLDKILSYSIVLWEWTISDKTWKNNESKFSHFFSHFQLYFLSTGICPELFMSGDVLRYFLMHGLQTQMCLRALQATQSKCLSATSMFKIWWKATFLVYLYILANLYQNITKKLWIKYLL